MSSKEIPISEIFETIQGEGQKAGDPVLFVRVAGCNLNCPWCDTKYALKISKKMTIDQIIEKITQSKQPIVVWSGGEPMLYADAISEIIDRTKFKDHHLESNGSIEHPVLRKFEHIGFSPKNVEDAKKCRKVTKSYIDLYFNMVDIKVVTDLDGIGKELIPYASMLMPFTTWDIEKDKEIRQKVWDYCTEHKLRYSPRLHVEIFGNKRKK